MTSPSLVLMGVTVCTVLVLVVPVVRHRIRYRENAMQFFANKDPIGLLADAWLVTMETAWVVWTFAYVLGDRSKLSIFPVPPFVQTLAWAVIGGSLVLVVVAQRQMGSAFRIGITDKPTPLVTSGLYRFVRNPIFTGLLGMYGGLAALTPSPWSIMGVILTVSVLQLQPRLEERHLANLHGEAWTSWARRVGRFLPGIGYVREEGGHERQLNVS